MPLPNAPTEMNTVLLPTYTIRPPDVLLIESQKGLITQPIRGQHLVRPDGTVSLGIYGPAVVAGRTVQQAREEIARVIHGRLDKEKVKFEDVLDGLSVDILAYNSSVYYIITDGAGLGEAVYRFPVTGNETVLDAISHINGLPVMSSPKRIWVARRNVGPVVQERILPVDWLAITRGGSMATNWQIMPGDRVFVSADPVRRFNNTLSKFLEPVERVLGVTLLGGNAVNSIRNSQREPQPQRLRIGNRGWARRLTRSINPGVITMSTRSMLGAAVLALSWTQGASAQPSFNPTPPLSPAPYNSTRIASPFLQMLRGGDAAANYYGGVLPEQQRRFDSSFLNSKFGTDVAPRVDFMVDDRVNLDVLEKQLPPTGHPVGFMIYNSYYNLPNQRSFIPYNPRPMIQGQQQMPIR